MNRDESQLRTITYLFHAFRILFGITWWLVKVFVFVAVLWGLLSSLAPFPTDSIQIWQEKFHSLSLDFPGGEVFLWIAGEWLKFAILMLALYLISMRKTLRLVETTSQQAAWTGTALTHYLSFTPEADAMGVIKKKIETTGRLSNADRLLGQMHLAMFSAVSGVPFLPEDVMPVRDGRIVSLQQDFKTDLSNSELIAPQKDGDRST